MDTEVKKGDRVVLSCNVWRGPNDVYRIGTYGTVVGGDEDGAFIDVDGAKECPLYFFRREFEPIGVAPVVEHPVEDAFDLPLEPIDPEAAIRDLFDGLEDDLGMAEKPVEEPAKEDLVVKPAHYTKWAIEPITYIMRNGFEFWRGNIVKYASRAGSKMYAGMDEVESEVTDLKKVIRYAEMRINQLEGEVEL
jgi:hypothetical protein